MSYSYTRNAKEAVPICVQPLFYSPQSTASFYYASCGFTTKKRNDLPQKSATIYHKKAQ